MALDVDSGRTVWSKQALAGDVYNAGCSQVVKTPQCPSDDGPDYDFGAPPILVSVGGRDLIIAGQKAGIVWAFDPARQGTVVWQRRVGSGESTVAFCGAWPQTRTTQTPRSRTRSSTDRNSAGHRLNQGWWAERDQLEGRHGGMALESRAVRDATQLQPGAIRCGDRDAWSRLRRLHGWALARPRDRRRLGHLGLRHGARIHDCKRCVKARGGVIDGPGPVVANGMVLVNSGYTRQGGIPGNVLLVFSAQ